MIRVMKCQTGGCDRPSSWKAGTWEFCDKHIKQYLFEDERHSAFGSAYRFGMYKADDFLRLNPHAIQMTVSVSENDYAVAKEAKQCGTG